jgi:hypothetical protein
VGEFEHRHCLLRSLGQHAVVLVVQLFVDPLSQTPNFNLCIDREGVSTQGGSELSSFVSNRLDSLQNSVRVVMVSVSVREGNCTRYVHPETMATHGGYFTA